MIFMVMLTKVFCHIIPLIIRQKFSFLLKIPGDLKSFHYFIHFILNIIIITKEKQMHDDILNSALVLPFNYN